MFRQVGAKLTECGAPLAYIIRSRLLSPHRKLAQFENVKMFGFADKQYWLSIKTISQLKFSTMVEKCFLHSELYFCVILVLKKEANFF